MRRMEEFRLHCVIADYLRLQYPNLLWGHCPNGEARSPATGAKLKRMGVRAGWADITIHWPHNGYMESAAIELKTDKSTLNTTQKAFRNDWMNAGGNYAICRSLDEVLHHLNAWGVPKGKLHE